MTNFEHLTKKEKNEFIHILYLFNEFINYKSKKEQGERKYTLFVIKNLIDDAFNGEIHLDEMKKMIIDIYIKFYCYHQWIYTTPTKKIFFFSWCVCRNKDTKMKRILHGNRSKDFIIIPYFMNISVNTDWKD